MTNSLVICANFDVDASFCLYSSPYSTQLIQEFVENLSNVYKSKWAADILTKIDICKSIDGFVSLKIEVNPDSSNQKASKPILFAEFLNHDSMIMAKLAL